MNHRRYAVMQKAVALALSGQCSNWWTVQARLRVSGCDAADVEWTPAQRAWLDQLCAEAARAAAPDVAGLKVVAESSHADSAEG